MIWFTDVEYLGSFRRWFTVEFIYASRSLFRGGLVWSPGGGRWGSAEDGRELVPPGQLLQREKALDMRPWLRRPHTHPRKTPRVLWPQTPLQDPPKSQHLIRASRRLTENAQPSLCCQRAQIQKLNRCKLWLTHLHHMEIRKKGSYYGFPLCHTRCNIMRFSA